MGYGVGIDVGTTYSAAAVFRDDQVRAVTLGQHGDSMPTAVFLQDGQFIVGDAARRRLTETPSGGAREFKRRMGDDTPFVIAGSPYSADRLMGVVIRHIVERVTEAEGEPPEHVVVTHPANWQAFKVDLLRQAATAAVKPAPVELMEEPVAAAVHYAHAQRIDPGELVGVYDLGGGTFDAAVLQRAEAGFRRLGEPAGIERLGGIDFDAAVLTHVQRALGAEFDALDTEDRAVRVGLEHLRDECVDAKETLSIDTSATIDVSLPGLHDSIRITRSEFEQMIRPVLGETMDALRTAIEQAGTSADRLAAVLLIGGSSRIPLISEVVSDQLGRPVAVDAHPKLSVAMGGAVASGEWVAHAEPEQEETGRGIGAGAGAGAGTVYGGGVDRGRVLRVVGMVAVVALVAGTVGWFTLLRGDDDASGTEDQSEEGFVLIDSVELENGRYRVNYEVSGFTPEFGEDPDLRHIHFFLDTTEPSDAGVNGDPPGEWNLTRKLQSFLTEFTPASRGIAQQMCAVVATNEHAVADPESGNCVDLPPDPTSSPTPSPTPTQPTESPTETDTTDTSSPSDPTTTPAPEEEAPAT